MNKKNVPENRGMESLKIIVKGSTIFFVGLGISKFITYFYRLFIARYFGPTDYGLFMLGLGIVSFFMLFANLGLHVGVTRYTAFYNARKNYRKIKGVLQSSIKLVVLFSVITMAVLFLVSDWIAVTVFGRPELSMVLVILSLSILFTSLKNIFNATFAGFNKIKYRVYSEGIFLNLTNLILVVIFGLLGLGIIGIAWAWTISYSMAFLLAFYFLQRKVFPFFRSKIKSLPQERILLSYSIPLALSGFVAFIVSWTDTIMLGFFKTASDVGIYNVALPTADLLIVISSAVAVLFIPVVTVLYSKKKFGEMKTVHSTVTRWIFCFNFPIFLLMFLFSRQILNVLFGGVYIYGGMALMTLAFSYFISSLFTTSSNMLMVLKKTRWLMLNTMIAAGINFPLNLVFIPMYGIFGASLATGISIMIGAILTGVETCYLIKLNPFSKKLFKPLVAGILSLATIYFLATYLISGFPVFLLIVLFLVFVILYAFLLLLLHGFEKEDIEMLKIIENKTGIKIKWIRNIIKKFV